MTPFIVRSNVDAFIDDSDIRTALYACLKEGKALPLTLAIHDQLMRKLDANKDQIIERMISDMTAQIRQYAASDDFKDHLAQSLDEYLFAKGFLKSVSSAAETDDA